MLLKGAVNKTVCKETKGKKIKKMIDFYPKYHLHCCCGIKFCIWISGIFESFCFHNKKPNKCDLVSVLQVWYSDRLHYYSSKEYTSYAWFGNDKPSLENQIKLCTKSLDRCCINLNRRDARAFSVCRIQLSTDGTLDTPNYNVKLVSTNPFRTSDNENSFCAQGNVCCN